MSAAFRGLETREPLTDAQIDGIARGLLVQLSLDEKISMMHGGKSFFEGYWAMQRNGYYRQPRTTAGAIPRLGNPGVKFSDGPRGFHGEGATTFPQGSARGASWDTKLEERIGDVMGREARALGSNMIGAPCINLARHPAWGRAQEGYRKLERDNATPAFPFGFGLSFTTFKLSDLRIAQDTIATDGSVMVTAEITNTGPVAGEEVAQLYVSARSSKVERAPKKLKAFTKVSLAPGETRTVRLAVPAAGLAYYDEKNGWIIEPGDYEVILGRHSLDDEALRARFAIQQPK